MVQPNSRDAPEADQVATRALLRAADNLSIAQKELAQIVGVSPASISRLGKERAVAVGSKEGELALLFLRMYRSLDAIVGGSHEAARAWFRADNHHLGGVPAELVKTVTGLAHVADYLDAMRGRL
jgi:DNA-binding XRE family transcriptional regulator